MKRWMIIGSVVLVAVVAVYLLFFNSEKTKYEFRLDKVSEGDVTMYVTATGTINAVISVEVGTQVSGIINKLYADFNSVVKEGQVIAQIDPTFLQQAVKDATASLERARAQYNDSKRILDRTKSLYDKNLESQANYDAALTNYESNQAALKMAQASLDRAKINLAYATIYAPISGVVIDRKVNVGQTVAASFSSPTLYTIANDLQKMQVQATIDETDIGRISVGQEATFTVDSYPDDRFTGMVSQIRLAPVTIQNVVNYTVIVDVDNRDLKLMPGMTANVRILVGSARNVIRVSNMALRLQPPSELIDSTKIKETAAAGPGGSGERGRWSEGGGGSGRDSGRGGEGSGDRRMMMSGIRDSIIAAHGGKMAEEDLRGEMRKVFDKMRPARPTSIVKPAARAGQNTKFGIQNMFPELQKSVSTTARQRARGRVWVLTADKKLEPVTVTTGLSDGKYTEIVTSTLKVGDEIVLGATSTAAAKNNGQSTTNPLAPTQQRPMGGGGPPR
jgi:HlyD family secretion protein